MSSQIKSDAQRLKRMIPRLRGKRIGVLGDLMLDRYLWGTASRLSPEAAVPVVDFVEQSECLGGAGNVAANLAALGARVECFGTIVAQVAEVEVDLPASRAASNNFSCNCRPGLCSRAFSVLSCPRSLRTVHLV